jgi:hypothetical protein
MFKKIRRLLNQFFNRSSTLKNEPLNRVSLVVLIIVDIFILVNVFSGLGDISGWHLSPDQALPCYSEWQNYQESSTNKDKDFEWLNRVFQPSPSNSGSFKQRYQSEEVGRLGNVSTQCLEYGDRQDKVNNAENRKTIALIEQKERKIERLNTSNSSIRSQYDSSLLEKIANQPRDQSINQVSAEKAVAELAKNTANISTLKKEVSSEKDNLKGNPSSVNFIQLLQDQTKYKSVQEEYKSASFWYPSIQITFQALFLLPLIAIALFIYNLAQKKKYALVSLLSWHLLVILFIPLVFKVFEFLQFGAIGRFIFELVVNFFGGLLFLVSYFYIFLIPIVGFGIIRFSQRKVVFNSKLQSAARVQKSCCIQCARKIQPYDNYCPHCGTSQNIECSNCHGLTYKQLDFCKHCGHPQEEIV